MTSVTARTSGKPGSACGSGMAPLGRMESARQPDRWPVFCLLFVLAGGVSGRRLWVDLNELT